MKNELKKCICLIAGFLVCIGSGCAPPSKNNSADSGKAPSGSKQKKSSQTRKKDRPTSILTQSINRAKDLAGAERQGLRFTNTKLQDAKWISEEEGIEVGENEGILSMDVTFAMITGDLDVAIDVDKVTAMDPGNTQYRYLVMKRFYLDKNRDRISDEEYAKRKRRGDPVDVELLFVLPKDTRNIDLYLGSHKLNKAQKMIRAD